MSEVCTLFEGSYHYGVAVLANSLFSHGYRGNLWAGYRGPLPYWAALGRPSEAGFVFSPAEGLSIIFVPLSTRAHLTNYKPDFMLDLMAGPAREAGALFYMDPDIVVNEPWGFFEEWVTCGIAVCEDINSPLPEHHPRREGWRRYFGKRGVVLRARGSSYANGGFIGVGKSNIAFLTRWKLLQDLMWEEVGGAEFSSFSGIKSLRGHCGFADCFGKTDQDALNAAVEASDEVQFSFLNRQTMGFEPGTPILPHALGPDKPWRRNLIGSALLGVPPRTVDKAFWRFADGPVRAFSTSLVRRRRIAAKIAAVIGRLVRRV